MKIKNLLISLGLVLSVGAGVGTALAVKDNAKEAKAAGGNAETHIIYCAIKASTKGSYTLKVNNRYDDTWYNSVMVSADDTVTVSEVVYDVYYGTFQENWGGVHQLQFQLYDGSTHMGQKEPISGVWTIPANFGGEGFNGNLYNYDLETWTANYAPSNSHTVTGYAVYDGVLDDSVSVFNDSGIAHGSTYDIPSAPTLANLKHFVGWYIDPECEDAYVAGPLNADLVLYAKVQSMTADDSYFYWIDHGSTDLSNGYVYFKGEYETAYNGISLTSCKVNDDLSLKGEGKLYKIPAPSIGNYQVRIHDTDDNVRTFEMTVTLHAVHYTWYDNTGGDGKYYYAYTANVDAGLASDFLVEAERIRNSVSASGSIGLHSVCGIDPSDAADLYDAYDALDANVKGWVNDSYIYTYNKNAKNDLEETHKMNVTYNYVMNQLFDIAMKDNDFAASHRHVGAQITSIDNSNNALVIIIASSMITLVAIGGYFYLRKRKEDR